MKRFLIILSVFFFCPLSVHAGDPSLFKDNNPDGIKYEFARSYISSLSYLSNIDKRWGQSDQIKKDNSQKKFVLWNIQRLGEDNMDLRVAKNYMTKYFIVKNRLMLKVTDTYVYACDQLIELNREERDLWDKLRVSLKGSQKLGSEEEEEFMSAQEDVATRRKEAMRGLVSSSVLMTKVLLSENAREKDVKKRLALSTEEREKLVEKLDGFARGNMDWELKPGQTFIQAAQAPVREVLEDSFYLSADDY